MTRPIPSQDQAGREEGRERLRDEDHARVGQGLGAPASSHLTEDPYIGVRVDHGVKPTGPLPAEEASEAGQDMSSGQMSAREKAANPSPPLQDVRVAPDELSVWEATGNPDEE